MTFFRTSLSGISLRALGLFAALMSAGTAAADNATPARELFGGARVPSIGDPGVFGSYARGCIGGAQALPVDGPTWQVMRLSRNRNWGHPALLATLKQLAADAPGLGWPGLLVGDISQPRGGPMLNGHASHQIGLDADIWLTPMPDRRLSARERDEMPFTSMLAPGKFLTIDQRRWTPAHMNLIMRAASYPQVQRIFVNPAIKKRLCDAWPGDRDLLGKVRPIYGHDAHFHIRLSCPSGAAGCEKQAAVPAGDDCGKGLAWWFTPEPWAPPKKDPNAPKPKPPRLPTLTDLPKACTAVLAAPANGGAGMGVAYAPAAAEGAASAAMQPPAPFPQPPASVPVPAMRPTGR